jgi:predicted CopG family antitoxin
MIRRHINIRDDQYEKLFKEHIETRKSISEIVRKALDEHFAEKEKKHA